MPGSNTVYVPPIPGTAVDNDDVSVSDEVVILLEANPSRRSALITNVGDEDMRVTTDGSDPSATHGKLIPAGSSLSMSSPYCPTDEVKAIRATAADTSANASEVS